MNIGDMKVAVLAITRHGVNLAFSIREKLPGAVCHVPERHKFATAMGAVGFDRLGSVLPEIWKEYDAVVCVMATGIVVRHVAPLLVHKATDPAVVVLDERGHYVISLVSGHLGGANALAREVASVTGGPGVITTASDVQGRPALDLIAREKELEIENHDVLSRFTRSVLEDQPFWIFDPYEIISEEFEGFEGAVFLREEPRGRRDMEKAFCTHESCRTTYDSGGASLVDSSFDPVGVWVSEKIAPIDLICVALRPRNLVVGLGCNRGTPAGEVLELLESVFDRENLSLFSIRNLASIDIKADERGLLEVAECLKRPLHFCSPNDLATVSVPTPSDTVARHVGVQSVCEATALLSSQTKTLLVPKQKTANVTLAIARVPYP